jgi:hypothetical protein
MPLLDRFEFLRIGFDVSYRASDEDQLVRIDLTTLERSNKRSAPLFVKRMIELINAGAACGSMFAPKASAAVRVSGPWDGPDAFGPDFHWVLKVRGVAPLFWRTVIDHLRRCGDEQPITTMRIRGEQPMLGDGFDVDTRTMREWLESADAYIDECLTPGFRILQQRGPDAGFSVQASRLLDDTQIASLKQAGLRWLMATASYLDAAAKPVVREHASYDKHLPRFEMRDELEGTVIEVRYEAFPHDCRAARAVLVNLLAKARADGMPIASVTLSHPDFEAPS